MEKVTIYSVADALGISASTVSRAFSRPDMVKDSVREQVLAMARKQGYAPNRAARGLATGRAGMLGLLIPDIVNPFFPPLIRAIQLAASEHDAEILLLDATQNSSAEEQLIERGRPQVDGFILASPRLPTKRLVEALRGRPAVVINRALRGLPTVICDNTAALHEAADHLHDLGHRRFALLRGPSASWAAKARARAIHDWAERVDAELVEFGPFEAQFTDARGAAKQIVAAGATGIFAFDDVMAAGVVAGLRDIGETVPWHRSLVGCDDVLLAQMMTPGLTTIAAPFEELGYEAVRLLGDLLAGKPVKDVVLQGEYVPRGTSISPREDEHPEPAPVLRG